MNESESIHQFAVGLTVEELHKCLDVLIARSDSPDATLALSEMVTAVLRIQVGWAK